MTKFGAMICLTCIVLVLGVCGVLLNQSGVAAVSNDISSVPALSDGQVAPTEEKIEMTCQYPVLRSYAGVYFAYDIDLSYTGGKESRVFDLRADVPKGFNYSIAAGYGETSTEIAAIRLDPNKTYPERIKLTVRPYVWLVPEPGDYPVTLTASLGNVKTNIQLKAIVTAKYDIDLKPANERLNTKADVGKDNYFTVVVTNSGTAQLEKINMVSKASNRPTGWEVTFKPEKFDLLAPGASKEVQIDIKPPQKTIAGDYMVKLEVEPESQTAWDGVDIRVTALTPTIWGWVGVGIVVLVIVGLAVMFMRLGRR